MPGLTLPLPYPNLNAPVVYTGGNPDLTPETSNSYTLGAVIQPRFLRGFALTADYWDIKIDNVITSLSYGSILNSCVDAAAGSIAIALACGAAILGASSALAAGPAGPLVIAHRGGALLMPEDTFPAFDNAVRLGADMLEFDMQMTADHQLVISHDTSVNPTFCTADPGSGVKPGPIVQMTLAQVLRFDCGAKHRAIYPTQKAVPGTHMPTPDAFFARYKDTRQLFFGEIKMPKPDEGKVDPAAFARQVEALVHKYRLEDRFILQSFDWRAIDAMHAINPRIGTCLLGVWNAKASYLDLARRHHADCVVLRAQDANAEQVRQLQDAGVEVFSDVVDDQAGWRTYLDLGVDALFTNDPAGVIAFLTKDRSAR
jgi:glycerophosphoryl diester phosphodiesterase